VACILPSIYAVSIQDSAQVYKKTEVTGKLICQFGCFSDQKGLCAVFLQTIATDNVYARDCYMCIIIFNPRNFTHLSRVCVYHILIRPEKSSYMHIALFRVVINISSWLRNWFIIKYCNIKMPPSLMCCSILNYIPSCSRNSKIFANSCAFLLRNRNVKGQFVASIRVLALL